MWIVELDKTCWLAPWAGDPGRTLVRDSARKYKSEVAAERSLARAKKAYPFRDLSEAKIVPDKE